MHVNIFEKFQFEINIENDNAAQCSAYDMVPRASSLQVNRQVE